MELYTHIYQGENPDNNPADDKTEVREQPGDFQQPDNSYSMKSEKVKSGWDITTG